MSNKINIADAVSQYPSQLNSLSFLSNSISCPCIEIRSYNFGETIASSRLGWMKTNDSRCVAFMLEGHCEVANILEIPDSLSAVQPIIRFAVGDLLGILTLASIALGKTNIKRQREDWSLIAGRAVQSSIEFQHAPSAVSEQHGVLMKHIQSAKLAGCRIALLYVEQLGEEQARQLLALHQSTLLDNFGLYLQSPNLYSMGDLFVFKRIFNDFVARGYKKGCSSVGANLNRDMVRQIGAEVVYDLYLRVIGQNPLFMASHSLISDEALKSLRLTPRVQQENVLVGDYVNGADFVDKHFWPLGLANFLIAKWASVTQSRAMNNRSQWEFASIAANFLNEKLECDRSMFRVLAPEEPNRDAMRNQMLIVSKSQWRHGL